MANSTLAPTHMRTHLATELDPPAYCLASFAMSSLLKTYCLVAIQCLRSKTTRTAAVANNSSFKPVLSADISETKPQEPRNKRKVDATQAADTPSAEQVRVQTLPDQAEAGVRLSTNQRTDHTKGRDNIQGCQIFVKPFKWHGFISRFY